MSNTSRRVSIYINDKEAASSIKALRGEQKKLTREIENGKLSEEQYIQAFKRLDEINPILQAHRKNLGNIESTYDKMRGAVGKFAAVAGISFGADMVIDYGRKLFNTSTQMDALGRKAQTVLGPALDSVAAAARQNANDMGLTNSQYVEAVTNIADLLKPMGFTTEAAAKQSIEVQNLSGALSEWTNGKFSAIETSESIRKALLGEREELERYGVSIKQSEVNARLAEQGFSKLTGQALKQAEAMATLQLVTEKSADAVRNYEVSGDSMTRMQSRLNARFTEISENLATSFTPIFEGLLGIVGDYVGVADKASESTAMMQAEFNAEIETLKRGNLSQENRKILIEEINTKYKDYLPNLITESTTIGELAELQAAANKEFEKKITLLATQEQYVDIAKRLNAATREQLELEKSLSRAQAGKSGEDAFARGLVQGDPRAFIESSLAANKKAQEEIRAEMDLTMEAAQRLGLDLSKALGGGGTPGTDTDLNAEAEKEKRKKAAEDAAKDREKQAEREINDRQKQLEKLQELVEKYQEEERLAALSAEDRKLAELAAKYDEQIKIATELEAKGVKDATAQRLELERQRDLAVSALRTQLLQEQFEAEQAQVAAQQEEKALADIDQIMAKQEAERTIAEALRGAVMTEREQAIFDLEAHYADLMALAQKYGIDTLDLEIAQKRELEKLEKDFQKKTTDEQVKAQQQKLAALQSNFQAFGDLVGAMGDLFGEEGKKSVAFQKAMTLAQIALDTASAISSLTGASEANPANFATFGAAGVAQFVAGLARILANIGRAKKLLGGAEVPQRKMGGWVDAIGADDGLSYRSKYIGQPTTGMLDYNHPVLVNTTGGPVLANERGPEFFVSNASLRNPVVANYARMIDNIQRGKYSQYATGGFTDAPAGSSSTLPSFSGSPTPSGGDAATNAALLVAINRLNANLENGIRAVTDDEFAVQNQIKFNKVNRVAGGTLG